MTCQCGAPDFESLGLEEAHDLYDQMHNIMHRTVDANESMATALEALASGMMTLAGDLADGDVLGSRGAAMNLVETKLYILAHATMSRLTGFHISGDSGGDEEEVNSAFEDIVSGLDIEVPREGEGDASS